VCFELNIYKKSAYRDKRHFIFRKKIRVTNKSKTNGNATGANQAESNYTDLEERSRASSNYTELQIRNDDYSSIEAAGHAYVNTAAKVN